MPNISRVILEKHVNIFDMICAEKPLDMKGLRGPSLSILVTFLQ